MSKPVYDIKAIDRATHSRTITLEDLIELFKDHCGAPESAQVLFNYGLGELKRKIEIVWTEDAPKKTLDFATEPTYGGHPAETPFEEWRSKHPCPPPTITVPVATYNVQVGDLVMVRDESDQRWVGPMLLTSVDTESFTQYRTNSTGGNGSNGGVDWRFARHLTDEERAQIKRI